MLNSIIDLSERVEGGERGSGGRGWDRGWVETGERTSQKQSEGCRGGCKGWEGCYFFTLLS